MTLSEEAVQGQIYLWYHNTYCLNKECFIMSIPNGGYRNKIEAMKLKSTGLRAGASDLFINHFGTKTSNRWHCVEVKKMNGVMSDSQIFFKASMEKIGTSYDIVTSLDSFKELIYKWNKELNN